VTRYRCVDAQKAAGFPVVAACQAAGVTRSGYYAWTTSAYRAADHHRQEARLVGEIRRIHARSHSTYGAPRVHAELRRRGWAVNHKRVERLMRCHGIVGYRPRRRRSLTRPDAGAATRGVKRLDGTIFHSDRGAEYVSAGCIAACQRLGLRQSMSRTGSCLDNAVAESWFASLKVELVHRAHYRTRAEARTAIFAWIAWYNRFRLHSTNGYLPPIEWEQQHAISPLPSTAAA
jgi:transposase InsO family protein